MNFNEWLKNEEGIISRDYFEALLDTLPEEGKRKVKSYYKEKYKYYMFTHPDNKYKQMKLNIEWRGWTPIIKNSYLYV